MMKLTKGKMLALLVRLLIVVLGVGLVGTAIALLNLAQLGCDPITVLPDGLAHTFPVMSLGNWLIVVNLVCLVVLLVFDRKMIGIGTVISMFGVGTTINLMTPVLAPLVTAASPMWIRAVVSLLGTLLMAFGISLYIAPRLGTGSVDGVSIILAARTGWQHRFVRVGTDIAFIVAGWLLGGVFGLGTVLCALFTGPLIALYNRFTEKLVKPLL